MVHIRLLLMCDPLQLVVVCLTLELKLQMKQQGYIAVELLLLKIGVMVIRQLDPMLPTQ